MNKSSITIYITALTILVGLTACGGGGTSSGGPPKEVTECIDVDSVEDGEPGDPVVLDFLTTYTNNCGFTVNLGRHLFGGLEEIIPLAPSASVTRSEFPFQSKVIACRPPSVPIETEADGIPFPTKVECS